MIETALILRLMRRELRGSSRSFQLFLACLALGVAAIAGVGSIGASVTVGLQANARNLLGGDIELRLLHRDFTNNQRQWIDAHADSRSEIIKMRAMARPPAATRDKRTLVELKAVDGAYPLIDVFRAQPQLPLARHLENRNGVWGAVVDANLLTRLGLSLNEHVKVGSAIFQVRATVVSEPDRSASLFSFGPKLLISKAALGMTGLVQPGSQIRYHARITLPPTANAKTWQDDLEDVFPNAGWRIRNLNNATPGVQQFIDRMTLFLSFVGLTVLLIGGLGVANVVSSYLEAKTSTIATLKCLGAPGRLIFKLYMAQVLLLAAAGTAIGLAIGGGSAYGFAVLAEGRMPVTPIPGLYTTPLWTAAIFGLSVALIFAIWPIARAREVPAVVLFRGAVASKPAQPHRGYMLATVIGIIGLAAFTIYTDDGRYFASWFVGGAVATMGLLRLGAYGVGVGARNVNIHDCTNMRLAIANLYRPGAATNSIMLSLGCGLAMLIAVGLIQGNLVLQVTERLPKRAPAFFFMDIQPNQVAAFDRAVKEVAETSNYQRVPTLRGRIIKIAGIPVSERKIKPNVQWAVRGDRALTYTAAKPHATKIVSGKWWSADYKGPPVISLDSSLARGFNVGVGDTLTFNVLGREVTATIRSLREIDWRSLRFDFAVIFAPGTLDDAPHTHIAAIEAPPNAENAVEKAATDTFPNISAIRVREALSAAANLLAGIRTAVTGTAVITILAGALVMAAAMTATRRRQVFDAVVFKVLGATRQKILGIFMLEYGLLGILTALIASGVGILVAWGIVTFLMNMTWVFLPETVLLTTVSSILVTLVLGFLSTWQVLSQKPTPHLRNH